MHAELGEPLATGYKLIDGDWTCSPYGGYKAYCCPGVFTEPGQPKVKVRGMHFCNTIEGCFNT